MIAACSELAEASQNAPCPSHPAETDGSPVVVHEFAEEKTQTRTSRALGLGTGWL